MPSPIRVAWVVMGFVVGPSVASTGCYVHEQAEASGEIVVAHEPPPDQPDDAGTAPGTEYVWIRGRWIYNGADWVWRRGHWQVRRAGYDWVPGHWVRRDGGWLWIDGHWHRP